MLDLAFQYHQRGHLQQAEQLYRQILQTDPHHVAALHLLGVIAYQVGRHDQAVDYISRALRLQPDYAEAHSNLGNALKAQGRLSEAVTSFQQALRLKPDYADAHSNLGNTLREQGRLAEAEASFRQALRLNPTFAVAHNNLGVVLKEQGKLDEAVAGYQEALRLKPDYAGAHHNLGVVLAAQGKLAEAVASFRQALRLMPDYAEAHHNLGNAMRDEGKLAEAVASYQQALRLKPDYAAAHHNLGVVLAAQGKLAEAVVSFQQALRLQPDHAAAYNNLGAAFKQQGRLAEAEASFQVALRLQPDYAEAHSNLGSALVAQGKVTEALACYEKALRLKPGNAEALGNRLLALQYHDGVTPSELAEAHADFERRLAAPLRTTWKPHDNAPDAERRLRVGFLSPDLGLHPVGFFVIGLLENLDRGQGEAICYSKRLRRDELTTRLQAAATTWRDVFGWTNERLAEQIRADRIDILFDLAGHTANNQLMVFACKPAPIQVTWAGYVGTTGLKAMDYILADRYEIPPHAEGYYCEKVLRMPDGYVCYNPPSYAPPVSALPALERGYVTFGSFNNPAKIGPQVIAVWARILKRLPLARLVLKYQGMDDSGVAGRLGELFAGHGIDPGRLELLGWSPHPELLAHYHRIDLALDPFPYNGGLSTCEALWMGVPVLTCPGETFAGRHSLTHLSTVGLTETISPTLDEYVELAVSLAADLPRLAGIRARLRPQVDASPLCDGKLFADNLMQLLRGVWQDWVTEAA
jgi:predicted O-linked N-acetylglucosamine transferase (SPINDLY family)